MNHQFSLASPLRLFLSRGISTSIYHEMKLTISFLRSETSSSHLFMISCFSTIILFIRIGVSKIKVTNSKQKLANAIYHVYYYKEMRKGNL